MGINENAKDHGVPWEDDYGYAQAVMVGNTIYVFGQLSLDSEGNVVGHAPIGAFDQW